MSTTSHGTDGSTHPDTPASVPRPRFQRANRRQVELRTLSLDQLIPDDHRVRDVLAFVQGLDLSPLYAEIRAVEGHVGRSPADPEVLVALWLYATIDGVQSARRLATLTEEHLVYQWIRGDVGINHHMLSDFRAEHAEFLEGLLTQSVAALLHEGLVDLDRIAQDGMRVRAAAGSSSFRRKATLEKCLAKAEEHMEALRREREEEDGGAECRRTAAARERAAREQVERIARALEEREKLAAKKEARKKGKGEQARASTTDPEARRMKMANNGYNPAYNVQFATTVESLVVVGVDVNNVGSDLGQMSPMVDHIEEQHGTRPGTYLADGGFAALDDIDALEESGTRVCAPIREEAKKLARGTDPYAPQKGDTTWVAGWRERMGTDEAKELYKLRAATAEFPNAGCRNRGLQRFNVRGLAKVLCIALWQALAHNFLRTLALRRAAAEQALVLATD